MRGGAIPLLAWGIVLLVLLALNWVWTGDAIQIASFAFAVLTVVGWALALMLARPHEALRRGAPSALGRPETVPAASYGSLLLAVGAAAAVFGLAFGHFLIYFGVGLMAVGSGVVWRERAAERRARQMWGSEEKP
jgi:low temperature requirement protein LtrA